MVKLQVVNGEKYKLDVAVERRTKGEVTSRSDILLLIHLLYVRPQFSQFE